MTTSECSAADAQPDVQSELCVGMGLFRHCFAPPTTMVTPAAGVLNTNDIGTCNETAVQPDGTEVCILIGTKVIISGTLRVVGLRPIVLIGVDDVTVTASAVLDVSSHAGPTNAGAGGGESKGCVPTMMLAGATLAGGAGGGGAGGSFRALGGAGGQGQAGASVAGGTIPLNAVVPVTAVRGGCAGGFGGDGSPGSGSIGGFGGGAVYLASAGIIRVDGMINASGAGGDTPKTMSGGGGGGGTGGFIGLDAPAYSLTAARVFAVGGSGAAGATANVAGVAGKEAIGPLKPGTTTSATTAGSGGSGGAQGIGDPGTAATSGGGGGGGGSTGYIGIANLPTATIPANAFAPGPVNM